MIYKNSRVSKPLRFAIGGPWVSLHPGLQHTLYADLVLSNQFDALVGLSETSGLIPLGAKSWLISDDFKKFTFYINTDLRFSDGSYLEAQDYKRSWEDALKLTPMSANSSLQDVLCDIQGFKQFKKTGTLPGIKVIGKNILEIYFEKPFRMALFHFSGNRYSAYKEVNNKYIGTGNYVIKEISENELYLDPNSYSISTKKFYPINLKSIHATLAAELFNKNEIDALTYGVGYYVPEELYNNKDLTALSGQEAIHIAVGLNGKKGKLFSDVKLRLAMQYLLYELLTEKPDLIGHQNLFTYDFQSYLPIQPGRLDENEVLQKIVAGKKYVNKLIALTKNKPLTAIVTPKYKWLLDGLKVKNITLSKNSKIIEPTEYLQYHYKKDNYDIIQNPFSVVNADPDGLYHAIGKNGAILNPVVYRERVGKLLEEGRAIIGQEKLDEHYKKVSRAILEEVPYVHIGFSKSVAIIRNDRIKVPNRTLHRTEGHLDIFEPK